MLISAYMSCLQQIESLIPGGSQRANRIISIILKDKMPKVNFFILNFHRQAVMFNIHKIKC